MINLLDTFKYIFLNFKCFRLDNIYRTHIINSVNHFGTIFTENSWIHCAFIFCHLFWNRHNCFCIVFALWRHRYFLNDNLFCSTYFHKAKYILINHRPIVFRIRTSFLNHFKNIRRVVERGRLESLLRIGNRARTQVEGCCLFNNK